MFKVANKLKKKTEIDQQLKTLKRYYRSICKDIQSIQDLANFDTILEAVEQSLQDIKTIFDQENEKLAAILTYLADDLRKNVKISMINNQGVSDFKVKQILHDRQ